VPSQNGIFTDDALLLHAAAPEDEERLRLLPNGRPAVAADAVRTSLPLLLASLEPQSLLLNCPPFLLNSRTGEYSKATKSPVYEGVNLRA